jgi:hypothetical protein
MKGYNYLLKPFNFEDKYKAIVPVGCRSCMTVWQEEHEFFKDAPRINGPSYCYDYCDNCNPAQQAAKKEGESEKSFAEQVDEAAKKFVEPITIQNDTDYETAFTAGAHFALKSDVVRELVAALKDVEWLEITIQKLLDENDNRDWVVESDVKKWASIKIMRQALKNFESACNINTL